MASFKTDESFLEKISMGAIGTHKVFATLRELGHEPIELERGSMNYKIWKKIKVKRIRVPDILCVDSGIRIESRAKTKLQISMSHSISDPERGWDYGMKDTDYVALIVCEKCGKSPIDWKSDNLVQFISIKDLRQAEKEGQVVFARPKGAQEGFESTINWVSAIATAEGRVIEVGDLIKYKTVGGRTNFVRLTKTGKKLTPMVKVGDKVIPNQILASVVRIQQRVPKSKVDVNFFLQNLTSLILSDRYAASKALSFFNEIRVIEALKAKLNDPEEHIYVKLESAASLARLGENEGYDFIKACLRDNYLQHVLEAVIVLAEIKTNEACKLLCEILLDDSFDNEIRAGAAWGLGEQMNKSSVVSLINSFNSFEEKIRIEASRALAKLTNNFSSEVQSAFAAANNMEKPGIAWALSKSTTLNFEQLISNRNDVDSRHWIAFILGSQPQERYITEIEKLQKVDPEIYFAVTLLWKIMTSWIYELKEY